MCVCSPFLDRGCKDGQKIGPFYLVARCRFIERALYVIVEEALEELVISIGDWHVSVFILIVSRETRQICHVVNRFLAFCRKMANYSV